MVITHTPLGQLMFRAKTGMDGRSKMTAGYMLMCKVLAWQSLHSREVLFLGKEYHFPSLGRQCLWMSSSYPEQYNLLPTFGYADIKHHKDIESLVNG